MEKLIKTLVLALLLTMMAGPSNAGMVTGTFTGIVYGAWGTVDGFDLTNLDGQSIVGTFAYDPAALLSSSGTDGATYNGRYQYSPTAPVTITQTISYQSSDMVFNFVGDSLSAVGVGRNYPAQPGEYTDWLVIQASGYGPPKQNASYVYLANTLGMNYLSNVQDLGSVDFSNLPSESIGNSTFGVDSSHPNTGGYSFTIESSTGIGFITQPPGTVPEPATFALVAAALLGVAGTRRRKPTTPTC